MTIPEGGGGSRRNPRLRTSTIQVERQPIDKPDYRPQLAVLGCRWRDRLPDFPFPNAPPN